MKTNGEIKNIRNFERIMKAAGLVIRDYGCKEGGFPAPGKTYYASYNKTGKKSDASEVYIEYTDTSITTIDVAPGFNIVPTAHIIVIDWVGEEEGGSNVLGVYYDIKSAKDALTTFIQEERDNLVCYDPADPDYTEEVLDDRWEYYKSGCYEDWHTVIYIASMPLSMM